MSETVAIAAAVIVAYFVWSHVVLAFTLHGVIWIHDWDTTVVDLYWFVYDEWNLVTVALAPLVASFVAFLLLVEFVSPDLSGDIPDVFGEGGIDD